MDQTTSDKNVLPICLRLPKQVKLTCSKPKVSISGHIPISREAAPGSGLERRSRKRRAHVRSYSHPAFTAAHPRLQAEEPLCFPNAEGSITDKQLFK